MPRFLGTRRASCSPTPGRCGKHGAGGERGTESTLAQGERHRGCCKRRRSGGGRDIGCRFHCVLTLPIGLRRLAGGQPVGRPGLGTSQAFSPHLKRERENGIGREVCISDSSAFTLATLGRSRDWPRKVRAGGQVVGMGDCHPSPKSVATVAFPPTTHPGPTSVAAVLLPDRRPPVPGPRTCALWLSAIGSA